MSKVIGKSDTRVEDKSFIIPETKENFMLTANQSADLPFEIAIL
ncbi:hypothetical protein [Parageobacillus thermoglucosidasius]|nr:hypothetical protein [Parageobacillus thermoglucosidasius]KYD14548.1 hypothetical protein B4168_1757 [Anoxybacillus flavithermus]OAO84764.1 hypothetical protein GT23_3369 [Parageobacillus thermoglucosidasius]